MSILSGLQTFSLGGAQAYFRTGTSPNLGRKTAVHDFVNSGSRYVEDLGNSPKIFNIEAEIVEQTWSAYQRKKKALEKVLNTAGIIKLVHPTYGKQNVVATVNSISENIVNELNCAKYSLTLLVADKNIFPTSKAGNKSFINRVFDRIFGENQTVLADSVNFYNNGIELFNDARDTIQDWTQNVNDVVSTINGTADEVAAFVNDINSFQQSLTTLMQEPSTLSQRMNQIYNNVSLITTNFGDLFNVALNLVGIGSNRTVKSGNSNRTEIINDNRNAIYNFNDVAATSLAYQVATNLTYNNQEDLDSVQNRLNAAFNSINPDTVDDTIYYDLQSLRNQIRLYLDTLRVNLAFIITQRVNSVPSTILAYSLYGDTSRAAEIITLNFVEDPAFVEGEINILSK